MNITICIYSVYYQFTMFLEGFKRVVLFDYTAVRHEIVLSFYFLFPPSFYLPPSMKKNLSLFLLFFEFCHFLSFYGIEND